LGGFLKTTALCLLGLASTLSAQERSWSTEHLSTRLPRAELDAITARGREIAAYDAAAWHGTDAVLAMSPASERVRQYIARRRGDGLWEVVFGLLSPTSDTLFLAYRAIQAAPGDTTYRAEALEPTEADTGYYVRAARAVVLAANDFGPVSRPYNNVVFPVSGSTDWWVYVLPAPTKAESWPLGADGRFRVTADGRSIQERRRLHNSIIEYGPATAREGAELKAGYHAAILDDRPEDTDVFLVFTRRTRVPEYVVSRTFYFRIDLNGRITAYDGD
jgi:hypothetical protein